MVFTIILVTNKRNVCSWTVVVGMVFETIVIVTKNLKKFSFERKRKYLFQFTSSKENL